MAVDIREVPAARTHALRRDTLRDGILDAIVTKDDDDRGDSFHLMAFVEDRPAGVVSCAPGPVRDDGREGWRLYQMGVDAAARNTGVGRRLVREVIDRVRARGGTLVWAMARDSAVGFYEACGFERIGAGYPGWNQIPHHTVVRPLGRFDEHSPSGGL